MKQMLVLSVILMFAAGCTTTQKGAGVGAVAGAGIGGIIGHQSGKGGEGAAIGAAVGALGGALTGHALKKKFCSVGGEAYDETVNFCPKHGVELKYKEK